MRQVETVLKGIVRSERLGTPTDFISPILMRVKAEYIQKQYDIKSWTDSVDFLTQLAYIKGKLLKGGEPDLNCVARNVINDWQRVSFVVDLNILCINCLHFLLHSVTSFTLF